MKLNIVIVGLLLASGLLCEQSFAQEKKGISFSSLPVLQTDDQSHFLLPMKVEGTNTTFLLDTGCGYSAIVSLELAKRLKKDLGAGSKMDGIGGVSEAYEVAFDTFHLGGTHPVQFRKTHVTDMSEVAGFQVKQKAVTPQGMIGSLTLMAIRGVFDTASKRILIPPTGAQKGLYRDSMSAKGALILPLAKKAFARPYLEVKINGKSLVFLVDTGAATNLLEPEIARELGLESTGTSGTVVGKGKAVVKGATRIKVENAMLAGKVRIPKLGFTVLKTKGLKEDDISYGGIIGVPVLLALKAQLDFDSYSIIIPRN